MFISITVPFVSLLLINNSLWLFFSNELRSEFAVRFSTMLLWKKFSFKNIIFSLSTLDSYCLGNTKRLLENHLNHKFPWLETDTRPILDLIFRVLRRINPDPEQSIVDVTQVMINQNFLREVYKHFPNFVNLQDVGWEVINLMIFACSVIINVRVSGVVRRWIGVCRGIAKDFKSNFI